MKIGNVTSDNIVFLAPMAGYTDYSFRKLALSLGYGLVSTELVSAKANMSIDELLPVLKEVGVVDSGGAGFCKIIEGMIMALYGKTLEVSEEEVAAELEKEREKNARTISVEDRAVENGDMIMLDFEGFVNGVAFDGGKGENYPLTIGSGAFIPGFEEQLVGKNIGEDIEVNVTFPEEYQAPELAGCAATFKCKVNEIKVKELPELDDDFAQDVSKFDTLAEYKEDVKAKLTANKADAAKRAKEDAVIEKIIENAQMDIPEAMIDTQARQLVDEFAQRIQSQGLSFEQYLQFTGMNLDTALEQMKPNAVKRIQSRLVLEAVVKAENLEVSEEDVKAEIAKMAETYKMDAEKLAEIMSEEEKKQIQMDMAIEKAVELVTEAAKEV